MKTINMSGTQRARLEPIIRMRKPVTLGDLFLEGNLLKKIRVDGAQREQCTENLPLPGGGTEEVFQLKKIAALEPKKISLENPEVSRLAAICTQAVADQQIKVDDLEWFLPLWKAIEGANCNI